MTKNTRVPSSRSLVRGCATDERPGVRGRARAYRWSSSTASRSRFLSDLRSFLDLRLCLRSFLRLRAFLSREVELLDDELESLLESEEARPIVGDVGRGGRVAPRGSRGGVVGRPSAIAARELRESPRRGVRTPGGRFATRARACEKRRVEGPWSWSRGARADPTLWHGRETWARFPLAPKRMKRMASSRLNWRARFDQGASVPRATGRRCGGARVAGWSWRSSSRRSFSSPAPRKVRDPSATVPPRPSPGGHPPSVIRP